MLDFITKLFGSNDREVKKFQPIVTAVNTLEPEMKKLSDDALKAKTDEFRAALKSGKTEDDILPEAFAVVREAARRVLGQRHFDVQLLGGAVLHRGSIAEMKTGEGKTLTSTLPIYLNALSGKGVHVVTVNDYLARRDCNWMGSVYHFLGLKTACIIHDGGFMYEPENVDTNEVSVEKENLILMERRDAYAADITYGTNNEFGFDYLRDNMVQSLEQRVQRPFHFAIVDEVDSILIDEARTPLIISAPDTQSTDMYAQFAGIAKMLQKEADYTVDEKLKAVALTDEGISKVENILHVPNIYDPANIQYVHQLEQAVKAHVIFERDRDYVVKDGQIIIVDDFTGRLMPGRRFSDGLHQALEAKEGVAVQRESKTLATITFQNFFRMYDKLSGMTGTALTSAEELAKVYELNVVEIPTNRDLVREDLPDVIYKTEKGKFHAIVDKVKELHEKGQPVLVGTIAIEKSEYLSALLKKKGVPHEVLNAKNHEREAAIIAGAGEKGHVTIATNMAGRGTDIKLGEGVRELGGLFILGTERHEARRIDNQLRGRAGRQGDPGMSQFYVSLEDELVKRFGGDRLKNMMDTLGLPEDQPIQNKLISRSIESAQTRIEGFNFDIRKHVLEYDDVMNKQREVVYKKRLSILEAKDAKPIVMDMLSEEAETIVSARCVGEDYEWDTKGMIEDMRHLGGMQEKEEKELKAICADESKDALERRARVHDYLMDVMKHSYNTRAQEVGAETMQIAERLVLLRNIDMLWMNHLDAMEYMRRGIGLRGYGQKDPLVEYKREAFGMFSGLMDTVRHGSVSAFLHLEHAPQPNVEADSQQKNLRYSGPEGQPKQFGALQEGGDSSQPKKEEKSKPVIRGEKVGRNDPCPCGAKDENGKPKKYKKCHGK